MAASSPNQSQAIAERIAAIRSIEQLLPVVLIVHDIRDWTVVHMSQNGLDQLGVTLEELQQMGTEYHKKFFNPDEAKDYVPGIIKLIENNNDDTTISHFQQVMIASISEWRWHLSAAKILMRDEEGKPLLIITASMPIDPKQSFTTKVQRLLEENNFLRKNIEKFQTLTRKERIVLREMASGLSCKEIAVQLKMSEATATTHRRNIKSKLDLKNNYDIIRFAQSFDLI